MRTVTIFRSFIVTLALLVCGALAFAQTTHRTTPTKQLKATELDKQASEPSIEQTIYRVAAAKLRQDKMATGTVELQVTVSTSTQPGSCYEICFGSGLNKICVRRPCYNQ